MYGPEQPFTGLYTLDRAHSTRFDGRMIENRVVTAQAEVAAPADVIFELIADPARQPEWDGNDNLGHADEGQRVRAVGDDFVMVNANGKVRKNHVREFAEGRLIAWQPGPVDQPSPGHLWRWELEPIDGQHTLVRHTYDWTTLTDERRLERARSTTSSNLMASIQRLKELTERAPGDRPRGAGTRPA